jgi:CxxC motif-containing protein
MKQITCIICPIGCRVSIETSNDTSQPDFIFSGNQCKKGMEFAKTELMFPVRTLTTTVRTVFAHVPVVPVRTNTEVPKEKIPEIMKELSKIIISNNIGIGEKLVTNILNTECDIILTSDLLRKEIIE